MSHNLMLFGFTEFLLSLSPGPAVLLVISVALTRGFKAGAFVCLGVIAVNLLYFLLSAVGVGAVLAASPWTFNAIRYIGAAYLAWMGFAILREIVKSRATGTSLQEVTPRNLPDGLMNAFMTGVFVQASSPKNILVFLAIIPQFVDRSAEVVPQFVALGVVSVLVELPILLGYAYLAASLSQRMAQPRMRKALDGASGLFLIGLAGGLAIAGS